MARGQGPPSASSGEGVCLIRCSRLAVVCASIAAAALIQRAPALIQSGKNATAVGPYVFSAPSGFSVVSLPPGMKTPPGFLRPVILRGKHRPDGTAAVLTVLVGDIPARERTWTLSRHMTNVMAGTRNSLLRQGFSNWKESKPQSVKIGPIKFLRVEFTVTGPGGRRRVHGVNYSGRDQNRGIIGSGSDAIPADRQSLPQMEAAIRSLRRK